MGSGLPLSNPPEATVKPGEVVLGYEHETESIRPVPQPGALGRNGSELIFRTLAGDGAACRRYLHEVAQGAAEAERLAARIMGRWPSGAPVLGWPRLHRTLPPRRELRTAPAHWHT